MTMPSEQQLLHVHDIVKKTGGSPSVVVTPEGTYELRAEGERTEYHFTPHGINIDQDSGWWSRMLKRFVSSEKIGDEVEGGQHGHGEESD